MTRVEIARGGGFHLVSHGNGLAYELSKDGGPSVFLQGDDAAQFREDWEAMERARPNDHTTALLRDMLERYT